MFVLQSKNYKAIIQKNMVNLIVFNQHGLQILTNDHYFLCAVARFRICTKGGSSCVLIITAKPLIKVYYRCTQKEVIAIERLS